MEGKNSVEIDNGEKEIKNLLEYYCDCPDEDIRSLIYSKVIELNSQISCGLVVMA